MRIFSVSESKTKKIIYFLNIPLFAYTPPRIKIRNKGKNNKIDIKGKYKGKIVILGNNNKIILTEPQYQSNINIKIVGDNNTILIEEPELYRNLSIIIGPYIPFKNAFIHLKKNTSIENVKLEIQQSSSKILIDENCMFSQNIYIRLGEVPHLIFNSDTKEYIDLPGNIIIGKHCWIGEGVTLMKNAQIPDNSIVAAKSVVTKPFIDINNEHTSNVLIAGNPAKIRKKDVHWIKSVDNATEEEQKYIDNYIKFKNKI